MVASCLLQGASLGLLPLLTCSCPRVWLRKSSARSYPVLLVRGLAGRAWGTAPPPDTAPKPLAHVQWRMARAYGNDAAETGSTDHEQQETAAKPKKRTPPGKPTIGSIGRKIDARVVHLVDENGTDLGNVHRADTIRMMEERGLKLVALQENADPPLYRLMSGKQIYSEQLKLRQQQDKPQSAQTQVKEMSFSADIGKNDLEVKVRKIQDWVLEKRHHVRVSIKDPKKKAGTDKMMAIAKSVLEPIADSATFATAPRAIHNGATVMCILRLMSERERAEHRRKHGADAAKATNSREKREANRVPEDAAEEQETEASVEEDRGPAVGGIGSAAREQRSDVPQERAQQPASHNVTQKPKEDGTS